jgi:hypothetical protein
MFEILEFPKQIYVILEVFKSLLQKQGVEGTQIPWISTICFFFSSINFKLELSRESEVCERIQVICKKILEI